MKKLNSRKLLVTLGAGLANVLIPIFCPPAIPALPWLNKLAAVYVGAEGIADAAGALKGAGK